MERISISRFKQMTVRDFQDLDSPRVIVNHQTEEPIAVLVPYVTYTKNAEGEKDRLYCESSVCPGIQL